MRTCAFGTITVVAVAMPMLVACHRESPAMQTPTPTPTSDTVPAAAPTSSTKTSSAVVHEPLLASRPRALSEMRVTHGEILSLTNDAKESGVTPGAMAMNLRIEHPVVRAVLNAKTSPDVALHFTYNGPTSSRVALGSGEQRVQIGLKLRAADGCNVVYAMLRLGYEEKGIVVQVKHNPQAHTHDDCTTDGYQTVRPKEHAPIAAIAIGSTHELRASMNGDRLRVWLDRTLVWSGDVGPDALTFDGPVGLRTDNGRFDIALLAGSQTSSHPVE